MIQKDSEKGVYTVVWRECYWLNSLDILYHLPSRKLLGSLKAKEYLIMFSQEGTIRKDRFLSRVSVFRVDERDVFKNLFQNRKPNV